MRRVYAAAMLAAVFPAGAHALEGDIDTSDRFSAVVRIGDTKSSCTGVVLDRRMILTAGHCLLDKNGTIKKVYVHFTDIDGTVRVVPSREVFVRSTFQVDYAQVQRDTEAAKRAGQIPDKRLTNEQYARSVSMDLGIIIPEDDVIVREQVRTVIDEPSLERLAQRSLPTPAPKQGRRAILAGFGQHDCTTSFDGPECRGDMLRRVAETDIRGHVVLIGGGQKSVVLFIGRRTKDGVRFSPIRQGDSGGPIFLIRPEHDDLLLIGNQSAGSLTFGIGASLYVNAHLIRSVRSGETYLRAMAETGAGAVAAVSAKKPYARVGVGWAHAPTTPQAEARALAQCRAEAKTPCKIVANYRHGCRFVVTGKGGGKIGWLVETSSEKALAACRKKGIRCKKPIGGCLS